MDYWNPNHPLQELAQSWVDGAPPEREEALNKIRRFESDGDDRVRRLARVLEHLLRDLPTSDPVAEDLRLRRNKASFERLLVVR